MSCPCVTNRQVILEIRLKTIKQTNKLFCKPTLGKVVELSFMYSPGWPWIHDFTASVCSAFPTGICHLNLKRVLLLSQKRTTNWGSSVQCVNTWACFMLNYILHPNFNKLIYNFRVFSVQITETPFSLTFCFLFVTEWSDYILEFYVNSTID